MNIGTSLKTISKNQLCSFIGTGGYVELAETDVLSGGSIVTAAAVLPLLNSGNDSREGILPPGYQKVEFLETSGTQYIKVSDIFGTNNDLVTGRFWIPGEYLTDTQFLFGSHKQWRVEAFCLSFAVETDSLAQFANQEKPFDCTPFLDKELQLIMSQAGCELNGTLVAEFAQASFASPNPYCLFTTSTHSNVDNRMLIGRCYSFSIGRDGGTLLDFVPALDPTGEPCMFDTVTKQPFYNNGTGYFRIGIATLQQVRELQLPDNTGNAVKTLYLSLPQEARTDFTAQKHLSDLRLLNWSINVQYRDGDIPSDYTKVDFLQSSGSQYIDTGIATDGNYTISCRLQVSSGGAVWGRACTPPREDYTGGQSWARFLAPSESNKGLWFYYNYVGSAFASNASRPPMWDISKPHDWVAVEGEKTVILDGERVTLGNQFNYTVNTTNPDKRTHYIFATNGVYEYGTGKAPMKLYSFTMQKGAGNTVLDLIPVLNENGVPGMWDKVGKQFYENSGAGEFIVGIKTLNDARMLNNALPVVPDGSTYSITLSLPVEASTDAPAQKALQDLAARGWSINVQYREDEIPAGYAKVSFLESSGTQYIELPEVFRIAQEDNPKSGIKIRSMDYKLANDNYIFRINVKTTLYYDTYLYIGMRNKTYGALSMGTSEHNHFQGPHYEAGKIYTAELNFLASNISKLNNDTRGDLWGAITEVRSQSTTLMKNATCKLLDCVLSYGTDITRNLIPVINTDGVPGMWDTVSQEFFENAGTGSFRVGLASKEAVRNLYLEPNVAAGTTIDLSVPAGTTEEDTDILKANNPNYTFNIQYRS